MASDHRSSSIRLLISQLWPATMLKRRRRPNLEEVLEHPKRSRRHMIADQSFSSRLSIAFKGHPYPSSSIMLLILWILSCSITVCSSSSNLTSQSWVHPSTWKYLLQVKSITYPLQCGKCSLFKP